LGRFITPDWAAKATAVPYAEFADPQSLNLYSYVRNVPTTRYDADGHCPDGICIDITKLTPAQLAYKAEVTKQVAIGGGLAVGSAAYHTALRLVGPPGMLADHLIGEPKPLQPKNGTQAFGKNLVTGAIVVGSVVTAGAAIVDLGATLRAPSVLAARAEEIHEALHPIAQNMRTTAVADVTNADGTISTLVSSSNRTVAPVQQAVLQPGETPVTGAGHAETTILDSAQANGQTVNTMGVSRTPCPTCQQRLDQAGVQVRGPN
jgi:hypothetical protein